MKIQNRYMQTYLDDMGRLLYYRVTFPIPKEFAFCGIIKPSYVKEIKGKCFYINQSLEYDQLIQAVNRCQILVAKWKIKQLETKILTIQTKLC